MKISQRSFDLRFSGFVLGTPLYFRTLESEHLKLPGRGLVAAILEAVGGRTIDGRCPGGEGLMGGRHMVGGCHAGRGAHLWGGNGRHGRRQIVHIHVAVMV